VRISDVEMSLLQGASFAIFMTLCALPVGRMVDTFSRTRLLSIGIVLWSLATAGSGLSRDFPTLLLCRIGVAVGEAVMIPSAYSMIGDRFAHERQGLALGIFTLGSFVGVGLAMILGSAVLGILPDQVTLGFVGTLKDWQLVFVGLLVPGLIMAAVIYRTREPSRETAEPAPPVRLAAGWLVARLPALGPVYFAMAFVAMAMFALMAWVPASYERRFHVEAEHVGHALGFIFAIAGALGTVAGGALGDWLAARLPYGRLLLYVIGSLGAIPAVLASQFAPAIDVSLAFLAVALFFITLAIAAGPASLQQVTPRRLRGLQAAVAGLLVNLLGLGIGPSAVAMVTDYGLQDEARLNVSLAIVLSGTLLISLVCGLISLKPYGKLNAAGEHREFA
jgi:MFS family permease